MKHLSVSFKINRLRVTTLPASHYTSFIVRGDFMLKIASTFSGLTSISRCKTMNPKNFPGDTLKVHFAGLSFNQYFLKVRSVSSRSSMCFLDFMLFTNMPST